MGYLFNTIIVIPFIAGIGFHIFKGRVNHRFDAIFHEKFTELNPVCYGRSKFKATLRNLLDKPNPMGIIFVSGAKNSGKTTAIKSALVGREHVAYISLRDKKFNSEADFVNHLKECFKITQLKDFMQSLNLGYISWIFDFIPKIIPTNKEYRELGEILTEIEVLLKHAYYKRARPSIPRRPVIFIDEIGNLQPMVNGNQDQKECARKFVNWIIKVTKDMMLCDVVFASHDGFSMETLNLADPLYTTSLMLPKFTAEELQNMTKKHYNLHETYITDIVDQVGSLGSHVIESLEQSTSEALALKIESFIYKERETLEEIYKKQANFYFYKDQTWGSFTGAEFECVMDLLVKRRRDSEFQDDNPTMKLSAIVEHFGCQKDVIKYFSNEGWLLYDPYQVQVQARNKIFLDVYEAEQEKKRRIASMKYEQAIELGKQVDDDEQPDQEKIKRIDAELLELLETWIPMRSFFEKGSQLYGSLIKESDTLKSEEQ